MVMLKIMVNEMNEQDYGFKDHIEVMDEKGTA